MQVTADRLVEALAEVESTIISRFSRKIAAVGHRFDMDDLIQLVWLKAIEGRPGCKAENATQLRHWILTIARNTTESIITANRGCAKRSTRREACAIGVATDESPEGYQPPARAVDPATQVEVKEQCEVVLEAIEKLPRLQSKCLRMRYLEQMEYDQIAAELRCTVPAVRNVVSRGLAKARGLVSV